MAITSLINPTGKPSIQDNLWHIATSDNSGQVDFKFVFDVYNGTEQLIRAKVYPNPTNGKGYFDAGPVVRNEMDYSWFNPSGEFFSVELNESGQIAQTYTIKVGEDYSGVTNLNLDSGNVLAYNWAAPLFKRRINDLSAKDNNFLTDRFLNAYVNFGEDLYIGVNSLNDVQIQKFQNNGTNTSSSTYTPSPGTAEYYQINASPDAVNTLIGSSFIDSSTNYYLVKINAGGVNIQLKVNVICNGKFTPIPLHFMNSYGVFETARFELVNRLSKNLERKTFEKRDYEFNTSSVDYYSTNESNHKYVESKINYGSKINWNYKLTMYPPTDSDYQWLSQLIDSPIIYAEIDTEYYPVTIVETNYEYSKHDFNGLRPLELNIEMNQKRFGYKR
jgi:hypothetical protein